MTALDRHRQRLLSLLDILAATPEAVIGCIEMLSDLEREQVLQDWNVRTRAAACDLVVAVRGAGCADAGCGGAGARRCAIDVIAN